jgi:hypothetical protein
MEQWTLSREIPLNRYGMNWLSSPGDFHPEALPEPYVSLSTHTAPVVKTWLRCRSQRARRDGWRSIRRASQPQA